MTTYKQSYDITTKTNQAPVGTEAQKAVVLQIDPKSEDKRLYVGGLAYCAVIDGSPWIIGCDESVFCAHTNLFFKKKNEATGKWEDQPNEEKAVRSAYEANGCCYAVNVASHAGAEALVKELDGKFIDSDFYIETEDGDKVSNVVKAILSSETPDIAGVISAPFLVLSEEDFTTQKDRKGKILPHPILENGKPLVIPHLPKLKTGKGSWGGAKAGFLATSDRVKEILAFQANPEFDRLYLWYSQDPAKVSFALALTGVPITVNVSLAAGEALSETSATTPTVDVSQHDAVWYKAVENFKLVVTKEYADGKLADFSDDAKTAIAHPDVSDDYKIALLTLSEYSVNGKAFPFGVTKQKLSVTGSIFKLSTEDLFALQNQVEALA